MQLGLHKHTKKAILINIQKKITIDERVFVPESFATFVTKVALKTVRNCFFVWRGGPFRRKPWASAHQLIRPRSRAVEWLRRYLNLWTANSEADCDVHVIWWLHPIRGQFHFKTMNTWVSINI